MSSIYNELKLKLIHDVDKAEKARDTAMEEWKTARVALKKHWAKSDTEPNGNRNTEIQKREENDVAILKSEYKEKEATYNKEKDKLDELLKEMAKNETSGHTRGHRPISADNVFLLLFKKLWPTGKDEIEVETIRKLSELFFLQNGKVKDNQELNSMEAERWRVLSKAFVPDGQPQLFRSPHLQVTTLIRKDYLQAYQFLSDNVEENPAEGVQRPTRCVIITGQPGIGKTIFMHWLLCKRVALGLPTAWQTQSRLYLFGYTGRQGDEKAQFIETDLLDLHYQRFLRQSWCLVDAEHTTSSGTDHNSPCGLLCPQPHGELQQPIIIFSTSRPLARWASWTKDRSKSLFYIDPWTEEELETLR